MSLEEYRRKRNFSRTSEPRGGSSESAGNLFVVQYHRATRPHYDFRLEWNQTLKSWAIPKGPCLDPEEKRLAVRVEDHPLEYADFEGVIPEGEYGAGTVIVWDRGTWEPIEPAEPGFQQGKLKFRLEGRKLRGAWMLVRMKPKPGERSENWLLVKERDGYAVRLKEADILRSMPNSVKSGLSIEQIASQPEYVWEHGQAVAVAKPDREPQSNQRAEAKPKRSTKKSTRGRSRKAPFPEWVEPELAFVAEATPDTDEWFHEIKFDGYRLLAQVRDSTVTLWTRRRQNWTDRFPSLVRAIEKLPVESAYFDGEVVALLPNGASSFPLLQSAFRGGRADSLVYFVFDLLYLNGEDLRELPLKQRKERLAGLVPPGTPRGSLQFAEHFVGDGPEFFRQCCRFGLEGIISKRQDSPYRSGRSYDWLKSKCIQIDQFVVGGYTDPSKSRLGFGALVLGCYDQSGALHYVGRVGTGFTEATLLELKEQLKTRERDSSPFVDLTRRQAGRDVHFVEPELVAQVQFSNWTKDGLLWHPSFQGIREDILPTHVVRDFGGTAGQAEGTPAVRKVTPPTGTVQPRSKSTDPLRDFRLTNPNRILYAEQGITKLDLATFYFEISDWILPHIVDRPLTLVRCPHGSYGSCFYQKHAGTGVPEAVRRVEIDGEQFLTVDDVVGLLSLVQMGVLEIHPWGSRADNPTKPDRLIFDLDPCPTLAWNRIAEAAVAIREQLAELGLESFVKTTGGNGLHVVCPLARRQSWEDLKSFAKGFATAFSVRYRDLYTISSSKVARTGKIYLDYRRNAQGATAVSAYSTRARRGAPVSVPVTWSELVSDLRGEHFRMANVRSRLESLQRDPWEGFWDTRQSLTASMRRAFKS